MTTLEAIDVFVTSRNSKGLSKLSIKWYRIILEYYASMYTDLPLDPVKVEKFLLSCKGGDERRHGFYRALKVFYRFLKRRYKIENPMEQIDAPRRINKLPRSLTVGELQQLFRYSHDLETYAYLQFLADTGARIGELAGLRPENIQHSPFGYTAVINGKTGFRVIPISDRTYGAILPYIPIKYNRDWLDRRISKAFRDAGIVGTAHTLRHTFCTLWEGSEFALQSISGHTSFKTLRIYRNLRLERVSRQHSQYTPLKYISENQS